MLSGVCNGQTRNENQNKFDRIIQRDFQVLDVTISKISDKTVEFNYPGEQIVNVIDVSRIAKIVFANGRVQSFTDSSAQTDKSIEKEDKSEESVGSDNKKIQHVPLQTNMIAVLPVPYVNTNTQAVSSEVSKFAQNDIYSKLISKSSNIFPLTVQDIRLTNSLLSKAGITYQNIDETPIEELHKILGTEYIIASKVSYVTTSKNNSSQIVDIENNKNSTQVYNHSHSETENKYEYKVYFDLYQNNSKIYTVTRQPFFRDKEAWVDALTYLLKRSPIYKRK